MQSLLKDFILETAAVTIASGAILSALAYVFLPRVRKFVAGTIIGEYAPELRTFIWKTIEDDVDKYDALRVKSFARQTAAGNQVVREMLVHELSELEVLTTKSDEYGAQISRLETSVADQGRAIQQMPLIASALESLAESGKETSRTMKEIHKEVIEHGKTIAALDGYLDGRVVGEAGKKTTGIRRNTGRRQADK